MAEDRRASDPVAGRQRELDQRVEDLARQLADVVNAAGESRQDLREYAIGLLREETERDDAPQAAPHTETHAAPKFSPLAFAILVGLISLPLLLLFPPLGMGLFGMAVVMGIWGLADILFRRAPAPPKPH